MQICFATLVLLGLFTSHAFCLQMCGDAVKFMDNKDFRDWENMRWKLALSLDKTFKCYTMCLQVDKNNPDNLRMIFTNGISNITHYARNRGNGHYVSTENTDGHKERDFWGVYVFKRNKYYLACKCVKGKPQRCNGLVGDLKYLKYLRKASEEILGKNGPKLYDVWPEDKCKLSFCPMNDITR